MPVNWYGKQFTVVIREGAFENMVAAGMILRDNVAQTLNTSGKVYTTKTTRTGKVRKKLTGYKGSTPGGPPNKKSGRLYRSTYLRTKKKKGGSVRVGARGNLMQYGTKFIQPRPWLSIAFQKSQARMAEALVRPIN